MGNIINKILCSIGFETRCEPESNGNNNGSNNTTKTQSTTPPANTTHTTNTPSTNTNTNTPNTSNTSTNNTTAPANNTTAPANTTPANNTPNTSTNTTPVNNTPNTPSANTPNTPPANTPATVNLDNHLGYWVSDSYVGDGDGDGDGDFDVIKFRLEKRDTYIFSIINNNYPIDEIILTDKGTYVEGISAGSSNGTIGLVKLKPNQNNLDISISFFNDMIQITKTLRRENNIEQFGVYMSTGKYYK